MRKSIKNLPFVIADIERIWEKKINKKIQNHLLGGNVFFGYVWEKIKFFRDTSNRQRLFPLCTAFVLLNQTIRNDDLCNGEKEKENQFEKAKEVPRKFSDAPICKHDGVGFFPRNNSFDDVYWSVSIKWTEKKRLVQFRRIFVGLTSTAAVVIRAPRRWYVWTQDGHMT